jgi:predicted dehydrogenase
MTDALGVAVIGAGYWGPNIARNIAASARATLRWVCDIDASRAEAVSSRWGGRATSSVDEVLGDPQVDVAVIATPPSTHAELGLLCIEAGKHLLVEKPLASTAAAAERLVTAARERGVVLMCDHTYCYSPAVTRIRELVHDGSIGRIRYFDSMRINLGLVQRDVDVFWDLGVHDLSILDFVLPPGEGPTAVAAQAVDPLGVGHACVGYLTMPLAGGGIAHLNLNWLSPTKIRQTIIGGSDRMVVWDDLDPAHRLRIFDKGVDAVQQESTHAATRHRLLVAYRTGDMIAPALREVETLSLVVDELVSAVVEGRAPMTDGQAGLRIVRILEAATASLESGGLPVRLDRAQDLAT